MARRKSYQYKKYQQAQNKVLPIVLKMIIYGITGLFHLLVYVINAIVDIIRKQKTKPKITIPISSTPIQGHTEKDLSYDKQTQRNIKGMQYEKLGQPDEAILLYENNILEGFTGSHPYERLAIIYSKKKMYEQEEKVLNRAIEVFEKISRPDALEKLESFKARLIKNKQKNVSR